MTNTERIQANNAELREAIDIAESLPDDRYSEGYAEGAEAARKIVDDTVTEYNDTAILSARRYAFYYSSIKSVNLPNLTKLGYGVFYYCSNLENASIPKATTADGYIFYSCEKLQSIQLPLMTKIPMNMCQYCRGLKSCDLGSATSISASAFSNCNRMTIMILRSTTMCTLANTNVFQSCYHILGTTHSTYNPNGDHDGYIYVPSALVDSYKTATNWSTYASQFRALEDYTVDGTITGALDESKI